MSKRHKKKKQDAREGVVLRMYENVPELGQIADLEECPNCNVRINKMGDGAVKAEVYPARIKPKPKNRDFWELTTASGTIILIRRSALFRNPEPMIVTL